MASLIFRMAEGAAQIGADLARMLIDELALTPTAVAES
jgi:hypothetical protein